MDIICLFLLAIALFWIGKIFFILQKSLNEITNGLNSMDERLRDIERNTRLLTSGEEKEPSSSQIQ